MPRLADISYSREVTIAAVRDYYQFLTKLYLSPSRILEPPEGGWPQINKETIVRKNDEVIQLLRHLPYIRDDGIFETPEVAPGTPFIDFSGATPHHPGTERALPADDDEWPPHVINLVDETRWSFDFILDTKLGVIYWYKCPNEIAHAQSVEPVLDNAGDYAPEAQWEWRCDGPAWAIPDMFEQLKREFLELNFVPAGPITVLDDYHLRPGESSDGSTDFIRKVYRDHGWPDLESYKKEDCLVALRNALKEEYPDLVDDKDE